MANDVKAGGMFVTLSLASGEFDAALQRAQSRMEGMASSLSRVGKFFAAFGAAGVAAFAPAITAASSFQETMSKFETVFGDQANAMKEFSDALAAELGRGRTQIAKFLSSAQDLFVPIGFDAETAEQLSKTITRLAIDLSSFNDGISDDKAFEDLQAALTGSGEVMKKYGVLVSQAAVNQRLLNDSIDPANATELQKVMARLTIIMEGTTAAQGDAIRTSASFANQMKRLAGELDNAAVAIGQAILPTVTKMVNVIASALQSIAAFAQENQLAVVALAGAASATLALGAALVGLAVVASAASTVLSVYAAAGGAAGIASFAAAAGIGTLTAAVALLSSPMGLVVVAAAAVVAVFGDMERAAKDLEGVFANTFDAISGQIASGDITGAFKTLMNAAGAIVYAGLAEIFRAFGDLLSYIPLLGNALKSLADTAAGSLSRYGDTFEAQIERAANKANYAKRLAEKQQQSGSPSSGPSVDVTEQQLLKQQQLMEKLNEEGEKLFLSTRTASERYADELARVNELYDANVISSETLRRATEAAAQEFDNATGAIQRRNQLLAEAEAVINDTKTAEERHADEVARLDTLFNKRLISLETYNRAFDQSLENTKSQNKDLQAAISLWNETATAAEKYQDKLKEIGKLLDKGLIDPETARRAEEQAKKQLELAQADATQQAVQDRIPTQTSIFGGQRASQIFGSTETVQKQQLDVQKAMLKEQQRTNEQLKKPGGLVFG